jgi:hypothetical protein
MEYKPMKSKDRNKSKNTLANGSVSLSFHDSSENATGRVKADAPIIT